MFSKKRVLILFSFSVSLLLSVGFINQVEASSNQGIVELKNIESIDMSKIDSLEKKSPQEMQAIYNKIANDFDSNVLPNISEKKILEKSKEINDVLTRTGFVQKDQVAILSNDYDANRAKLRAGNLIETSLNLDDGMSSLQIAKTVSHANAAKKWSLATYPSNSNHEDAARHFAWNYLSTKDSSIGQLKTKIATTNHEWGLVLLPGALSYFDDKYDYYVSIGNSEPGANALIATSAYLSYLRHNLTLLSENSYSIFKSLFTVDNIMDLNNNCYGRAYSVRYPSNTVFSSFTKAISNKEIILSQSNVDNSAYYIVWNNKWYKSK